MPGSVEKACKASVFVPTCGRSSALLTSGEERKRYQRAVCSLEPVEQRRERKYAQRKM